MSEPDLSKIKLLSNSTVRIDAAGKIIYIDPYGIGQGEKTDLVLVTHPHFDHLELPSLKKLIGSDTIVVTEKDAYETVCRVVPHEKNLHCLYPGESIEAAGVKVHAVPAYNANPQRLSFHPKSNKWVGYILESQGIRVYHAGDTDFIGEMKQFGKLDIAFLPIGGTYTMSVEEAAEAAKALNARVTIPMHFRRLLGPGPEAEKAVQRFSELLAKSGLKAAIMDGG